MATKRLVLRGVLGAAAILFSMSAQAYHYYHQPDPTIKRPYPTNIEREIHYFPWGFSKEYIIVRNKYLHERRSHRPYYRTPQINLLGRKPFF